MTDAPERIWATSTEEYWAERGFWQIHEYEHDECVEYIREDLARSREAWKPEDGDTICQECGSENPVWRAPNEIWNRVMGCPDAKDDPGGILCPTCFIRRMSTREAEAVAAAYEAAAELMQQGLYLSAAEDAKALRALTPADAQAALEARDARVWNEAIEAALSIVGVAVKDAHTDEAQIYCNSAYDGIEAIKKPAGEGAEQMDWAYASPEQIERQRKQVVIAANVIASSPLILLEDAEKFAAQEYDTSWGYVSELVAIFISHLAGMESANDRT